ncbi:hypothetical protein [Vibrio owensii]|uniref:hypothetical protein n=1 Tax=Vibrio owensii TaxID=696485 RepID=UPI003CC53C5F
MDSKKILDMLYEQGHSKGQVEKILLQAIKQNNVRELGRRYANFKAMVQEDLLSKHSEHGDLYRNLSHLKSVDVKKILTAFESLCDGFYSYTRSDSYEEREAVSIYSSIGLNAKFYRDHELEKPLLVDIFDDMVLSTSYRIQLNCEEVFFTDSMGDWSVFASTNQSWIKRDDLNWILVCKDFLIITVNGLVQCLSFNHYSESYFSEGRGLDRELIKFAEGDFCKCLALGNMSYDEKWETWRLRFVKDDIYGLVANKANNNFREIVKPYKPYHDGHFYVDTHGYIDGKLAYITLKGVFPQYYDESSSRDEMEPLDIVDGSYYWLYELFGFRYFHHHSLGSYFLSKGDSLMPIHGMLSREVVAHDGICGFGRLGSIHVEKVLNDHGHNLSRPKSQYVTEIHHSQSDELFSNVGRLSSD